MKKDTREQFIARMPPTFLDTVCHGTSIIIGDRIIKKSFNSSNVSLDNFLLEDGHKYGLLVLEDIAKLEKKYRLDNEKLISELQKGMLNVEDELLDIDIKTFQTTVRFKTYLLDKIFPSFGISDEALVHQVETVLNNRKKIATDDFHETDLRQSEEMSYSSNSSENELFARYLQTKKQGSEPEAPKKKASKGKSSNTQEKNPVLNTKSADAQSILTKNLLRGQNIYIHYERIYALMGRPFFEDPVISYARGEFYPHPGIVLNPEDKRAYNLALLRKAYKGALVDQLEKEAFDNNPYRQKMTVLNQKLDAIINGDFLKKEGIGIQFISPNVCYLTKRINEFVLKDEGGKLHYFAPTRVGVEITYQRNNSITHGPVVVMDSYMPFPFLNSDRPITSICTGNGKEIYENSSLPDEVQIVQKLNIGEHTLYRGYRGNFTPYSRLNDSRYSSDNKTHRRITKKEMDELGLKPSNT